MKENLISGARDLIPDAQNHNQAEKDACNRAALVELQQTLDQQFRYAAAVHIPVAWQVSAGVMLACHAFFKEAHDVTQLNSWLSYLIPALAGAATMVLTKNGIEDTWLRPASMRALIKAKRSERPDGEANVRVFDEESNRLSDDQGSDFQFSCPGTPNSSGFSEGEASSNGQDEVDPLPYQSPLAGAKFHTVNSESSLSAPLLPPSANYTLVAQMAERELGQHAVYKASVLLLGATLWLMSLALSDDSTDRFDIGHGAVINEYLTGGSQVLFHFLSGVLFPVAMQALGVKLADHWPLVTAISLASLVAWQIAMTAVDSPASVNVVANGIGASMVAAGTIAVDQHYRGQPSAVFNRGLNAMGTLLGQVVTCGGVMNIRPTEPALVV